MKTPKRPHELKSGQIGVEIPRGKGDSLLSERRGKGIKSQTPEAEGE